MKIIAINDGHNASCIYMEHGVVLFALQEERLSRVKNQGGIPKLVLDHLSDFGVSLSDVDKVIFTSDYSPKHGDDREKRIRAYKRGVLASTKSTLKKMGAKKIKETILKEQRKKELIECGAPADKIMFLDHHLCHAASAYYGWGKYDEDVLIFTNDGAGDDLCATVSIGRCGELERIASVHMDHSIGELWALLTAMMGMVPLEHEYKLMGIAPYAPTDGCVRVKSVFDEYFSFSPDGLTWRVRSGCPSVPLAYEYFRDKMEFMRFDWIAGGLQLFTEEFLCRWVRSAIEKTGIKNIALAGGTFMNVKANQKICELNEVKEIFVFPSCGDETLPFGAAYYVNNMNEISPREKLQHLYLGMEYSDDQIEAAFNQYSFISKCEMTKSDNISLDVATLISEGNVVGWFQGKEEFGARSLGARSLVADPTKPNVIKEINEMIKSRDFWMPFASSMLQEGMEKYLVNPKNIPSPYMIITFNTTKEGVDIEAGRHPYDLSCRPQVVTKEWNCKYHELLEQFKNKTGRLGVLNTSFNLHGLPIASSPEDAFLVLDKSGLSYLAIGSWIVSKC